MSTKKGPSRPSGSGGGTRHAGYRTATGMGHRHRRRDRSCRPDRRRGGLLGVYVGTDVPAPGDIKQAQVSTIVNSKGRTIARIVPEDGNRTDVKISGRPGLGAGRGDRRRGPRVPYQLGLFHPRSEPSRQRQADQRRYCRRRPTITQQYVKNAFVGNEVLQAQVRNSRSRPRCPTSGPKTTSWPPTSTPSTSVAARTASSAASQAYFRKPVQKLTPAEGALLAGVIRSPSYLDPAVDEDAAKIRWNYVLDGMVTIGAMSPSDRAAQKFPGSGPHPRATVKSPPDPTA